MEFAGDGFGDFAGLKAAYADPNAAHRAVFSAGFDALEIGVETPETFSGYFGTGAAFSFHHTASGVFHSRVGTLMTYGTTLRHGNLSFFDVLKITTDA